jgi:hypothetical protein
LSRIDLSNTNINAYQRIIEANSGYPLSKRRDLRPKKDFIGPLEKNDVIDGQTINTPGDR